MFRKNRGKTIELFTLQPLAINSGQGIALIWARRVLIFREVANSLSRCVLPCDSIWSTSRESSASRCSVMIDAKRNPVNSGAVMNSL